MSKLFRSSWLRWTLVLGVLIALGCGIYQVQEPTPMCEISAAGIDHLSIHSNGHVVAFSSSQDRVANVVLKCVRIWDARSGFEISRFLGDNSNVLTYAQSGDGRYIAVETCQFDRAIKRTSPGTRVLHVIDSVENTFEERSLPDIGSVPLLAFSDNAKYLVRTTGNAGTDFAEKTSRLEIFDVRGMSWLHCRSSIGVVYPKLFNDDILLHAASSANADVIYQVIQPGSGLVLATWKGIADFQATPNAVFLLRCDRIPDANRVHQWQAWNLRTLQCDGEFRSKKIQYLSPDGRFFEELPSIDDAKPLTLRALPSGFTYGTAAIRDVTFMKWSADSKLLAVVNQEPALAIVDVPTMKVLWKVSTKDAMELFNFGFDGRYLFTLQSNPREIQAYDSQTGALTLQLALPVTLRPKFEPLEHKLTSDGKRLLVHAETGMWLPTQQPLWEKLRSRFTWLQQWPERANDVTVIFDAESAQPIFYLQGWHAITAIISPNGKWLATTHADWGGATTIRCWDVDAQKPLHWAIGVPATLATLVVLLAWWRGRRKKSGAAPCPS